MDVDKGIEKSIRRTLSDVPLIRERTLARTRHTFHKWVWYACSRDWRQFPVTRQIPYQCYDEIIPLLHHAGKKNVSFSIV